MLGPDTQKQSLGRRSKFGRSHLEKLGPSSGYEYHHKETIRQTDGQYTPLLSQLQQNLLNMQMFSPALSLLCTSPALSSSLPSPPHQAPFLALPPPKLARQKLWRRHPLQTLSVSELWVRMFAQMPHSIIYLEGCQLEKC